MLTGGLSRDLGLVAAVTELVAEEPQKKKRALAAGSLTLEMHPDGILAGALGAALLGAYRCDQLERRGQALPGGFATARV